jgi:hypothetical protein
MIYARRTSQLRYFSAEAAAIEGIIVFLKSAIETPSDDLISIAIEAKHARN